jgi:hypothetical protein
MDQSLLEYMFGPQTGPTPPEQERQRRLNQAALMRGTANQAGTVSSDPGIDLGQGFGVPSAISPAITQAVAQQQQQPMQPPVQPQMPPQQPAAPQARPRALPQATGGVPPPAAPMGPTGPAGPAAAPTGLAGEEQALRAQEAALQAATRDAMKPGDRSAMEATWRQRQQGGVNSMLTALAAKQAGQGFEPFQAQYLKQAAAADEPMKMTGGTMTKEGFIEDPGYAQELKIKQTQAELAQTQHKLDQNLTRQDRKETEARHEALQLRLARENHASSMAIARLNAGGAGGTATQIGTNPETQGPVFRHKDGSLTHYVNGKEVAYTGSLGPKAGEGKHTEGERTAAGYRDRMVAVEGDINKLAAAGGQPSLITKAVGATKLGRIARPYIESTQQQNYRAVQEDWVRAKLRKESGASIPPDEMEREIETYFPQPGETDPALIQRKAQARAQAVEQMRTSAGTVQPSIAAPVGGASGGWSVDGSPAGGGGSGGWTLPGGWSGTTRP